MTSPAGYDTPAPIIVPFADLLDGDLIIAVDGRELPASRRVTGWRRDGAVTLHNPNDSGVEWAIYPDSTGKDYLVIRKLPAEVVPLESDDDTTLLAMQIEEAIDAGDREAAVAELVRRWRDALAQVHVLNVGPISTDGRGNYVGATGEWLVRLATRAPRIREGVHNPGVSKQAPEVGDVVWYLRGNGPIPAVVTYVGRTRMRVAYTTPHSVRTLGARDCQVAQPYMPIESARFVDADAPAWWTR